MNKRFLIALAVVAVAASACTSDAKTTSSGDSGASSASGSGASTGTETVTLVTHSAFALSPEVLDGFEARTGIHIEPLLGDDAGAVVNQAILTKSAPVGDVLYGVDGALVGKALDAGLFEPYDSRERSHADPVFDLDPKRHRVTSIDYSDVCVNTDKRAFGAAGQPAAPLTLDDLANPVYKGMLVVENPATSSTGLAFLLATVARYGDDYLDYWTKLKANDVKVVEGWTQAYQDTFTAGGGSGDRPLVVSYATSPPADVVYGAEGKDTTDIGTVIDGCYRQVEAAGILTGTAHRAAAEKVIDFLAGSEVQADVPLQMFVFPVRKGTPLPDVFTRFIAPVANPLQLPAETVAAKRDGWVADWTSTVLR